MMSQYRAVPRDGLAWVTGASSGIGKAVTLELSRRGFVVIATARRLDQLEQLAQEAEQFSGRIIPRAADVTDRTGMAQLVASLEQDHGPVNLAFFNVGTFLPDDLGTFGGDGFRATFDININGTLNALGPLLPLMQARGRGQVAINASVAGYGGLPRASAYGATKAALINMCESLKFSLDPQGITIQVVNPGFVRTPLTDKNDFPMPFLVELDEAAHRICDGFAKGGFEIAFPRRLAWILKFLNMLPYPVYFWLLKFVTREKHQGETR